jgi:hypothetical protein
MSNFRKEDYEKPGKITAPSRFVSLHSHSGFS